MNDEKKLDELVERLDKHRIGIMMTIAEIADLKAKGKDIRDKLSIISGMTLITIEFLANNTVLNDMKVKKHFIKNDEDLKQWR